MAQPTVPCRACGEQRVPHHMLRIECNIHEEGNRDCLAPFYVCRPALSGKAGRGHRPDCLKNGGVVGFDIHRIAQVAP
jgi:hypothetical protein